MRWKQTNNLIGSIFSLDRQRDFDLYPFVTNRSGIGVVKDADSWTISFKLESGYMSDDAIVHQAQHGDLEAFEVLVHRHAGSLVSFLHRFMPDRDDAEDLAQEVFLKAFKYLSKYDASRGEFRNWLFRIATNTGLDALKQRKRRAVRDEYVAQLERETSNDAVNPVTDSESIASIKSALQSLPPAERQVVILAYYHDLSWREISNTFDIPLGTVKSRMHSALKRLRNLIVSKEDGEFR